MRPAAWCALAAAGVLLAAEQIGVEDVAQAGVSKLAGCHEFISCFTAL